MKGFNQSDVYSFCLKYGPQLKVAHDLNGARVMLAIAKNESSCGLDCGPRHEPRYDVRGAIWASSQLQQMLVDQYGSDAAMSYGPWQMMFINFKRGLDPRVLRVDLNTLSLEFVRFFNSFVIQIRKAQTLEQIGQVWNFGHVVHSGAPPLGVRQYCTDLATAYASVTEDL